jgi:rhodanese-related sulfurtransferase/DNA-binding transcriptional ArsR family regulator
MNQTEKRAFKDQLYEQFARIGKALASPHRLELLDVLAQCERTVEALAEETGMTVANASQHLQVLRAAHLVEVRREGVSMYYRLADDRVFTMWNAMRTVGEAQLAEIDRVVETYLHDRLDFQPLSAQELLRLLNDEQVVVLDVRPAEEYLVGHLPHARSLPVTELEARLAELPADKAIVAYCRGPYCVFADEAVALLRQRGYHATRLHEGFPDWHLLGLPIEAGKETLI